MKHKSDAPEALKQYLADTRVGPSVIIRSDDAPELMYGRFSNICKELGIKREFMSASTAQLNVVAERHREISQGVCISVKVIVCRHGATVDGSAVG